MCALAAPAGRASARDQRVVQSRQGQELSFQASGDLRLPWRTDIRWTADLLHTRAIMKSKAAFREVSQDLRSIQSRG